MDYSTLALADHDESSRYVVYYKFVVFPRFRDYSEFIPFYSDLVFEIITHEVGSYQAR